MFTKSANQNLYNGGTYNQDFTVVYNEEQFTHCHNSNEDVDETK